MEKTWHDRIDTTGSVLHGPVVMEKNDQIMLMGIHVTGVMSDNNWNSNDARF